MGEKKAAREDSNTHFIFYFHFLTRTSCIGVRIAWSAALRFAPRKTAAAKAKAKPNAAFVASFTSAPPSTSVETAPKGALSRAPGVPPSQPSRFDSAKAEPKAEARKEIDTSDLNLTALALPSISTDDEWLISELQKHPVFEAPPFSLPAEQVEREKVLIRQANAGAGRGWNEEEERGEDGVEGGEEDVNGFLGTSAGRRAMKRKVSPLQCCLFARVEEVKY